ncbi:MAG: DNA-directed RNA polymerase subunit beta', partial [Clostridia bacterium]|nr:DNA-directed RNA polymerase subunit beta' [Clostridia bacterium]
ILVEGRAIKLHPLVCTAYNADFDGDQMAVHVPLSAEAQAEARLLMLAANNLLKPSDGKPVAVPTQDMVLGSYYLTIVREDEPGVGKIFRDRDEARMAYDDGVVGLHAPIKVRYTGKNKDGETITRIIDTTVGYIIFNDSIPQDLGFVDRSIPGHELDLEIGLTIDKDGNFVASKVGKKLLGKIIDRCIKVHGTTRTAEVLDSVKNTGYHYSTRGAITVAVVDAVIPPAKKGLIDEAESVIDTITKQYNRGLISEDERHRLVIEIWDKTTNDVMDALKNNLEEFNPIFMMADSGARGSMNQIRQLAGMRGLIANTSGRTIETPIRANYREGLNILEYFISSRGARKGLADTALRTADSGYLTRRLVDVSHDVIIREDDCGSDVGIEVYDIKEGNHVIEPLAERLVGRYFIENLYDENGNLIMDNETMMTDEDAARIVAAGVERVKIRSVLNCRSKRGVCKKCYGANLANGKPVSHGEAVGIIAAQSIGEPGTQLTMRTFHTGGIASAEDITQGLPRVEELFEARKPKRAGYISEIEGDVRIQEVKRNREIVVTDNENKDERKYTIPYGYRIIVQEGQHIQKGAPMTEGALNPHDVLAVNGIEAVQDYIIAQVQSVYRLQGVDINDKHIEVIVSQMMKKVKVLDAGSSDL